MKRFVDFAGAVLSLALSLPLWPVIFLTIKLESRGPFLVKLARVSAGHIIYVYKFRSMVDGAHTFKPALAYLNERTDGPFFKIKNDPRLTRVGKIIRRYRLDEIPQLINVLKGDLSLVGPRPHEPEEVLYYPDQYRHLILVKAGITGLSQVSGASSLSFFKELALDGYYIDNRSFWFDLKILAKTVAIMLFDPTAV